MMSNGGPTDFHFISVEDYFKLPGQQHTLEELHKMARAKGKCEACEALPKWRLGGCDMCFPCTTGEHDASDDYELIQE